MRVNRSQLLVPAYQAPATLSQAAPVQNTWYTALNTTLNARILAFIVQIATTGEDLQVKVTLDGQTINGQVNITAVAGTDYHINFITGAGGLYLLGSTTNSQINRAFLIEGKSVKIEVRKVTANGAGNLNACVSYQKW
jgi:Ca2+-binding RTX toxin-like protein